MQSICRILVSSAVGGLLQLGLAGATLAQPSQEEPSLRALGYLKTWVEPTEPFKIAGPIHYVGTRGLAAYLITTPNGHILLDGGLPQSAGDLETSIRTLGFRPADIRLLLITHPHIDHAGTAAHFMKLSGAEAVVMDRDFEQLKSGGKTDPVYGAKPALHFPGATAERVVTDGETVALGNITMIARLGAGHTPGATTWITKVVEDGKSYNVTFPCCTGVNPDHRLVVRPSYPGIADDYRRSFRMLESLNPDIWLGAHTETFGFEDKRTRAATQGVGAWVDPDGYRRFLAAEKARFDALVAKEK
jgi:metallo-beta-lactamase class B